MVLAAASAFALHDTASGAQAPSIAFMARGIGLVLYGALDGGVTLPAMAGDEEELFLGDVADELAVALVHAMKLMLAAEVFNICHLRHSVCVVDGASIQETSMKSIRNTRKCDCPAG